jgi:hypothetical protein
MGAWGLLFIVRVSTFFRNIVASGADYDSDAKSVGAAYLSIV